MRISIRTKFFFHSFFSCNHNLLLLMGRGKKHTYILNVFVVFLKLSLYSVLFFINLIECVCACAASLYVRLIIRASLFYSIRFQKRCVHCCCCSRIHLIATIRSACSIVVAMMLLLRLPLLCFVFYSVSILRLIHFDVFSLFISSLIRQCAHTHSDQ